MITNINKEPNTYLQAIKSLDSELWIQSMNEEINELKDQNTYILVNPLE